MYLDSKTKRVLTVIVALPLFVFAQETHLDIKVPARVASGFFGSVKKVTTEYNYNMSDRKYKEIQLYDEAGNLKSRTKWNSKGDITFFVTNTFDEAGCFINQRVEDIQEKATNDYEIVLNIPTRKIAYRDKITGEVEVLKYNASKYRISATIKKKGKRTLPLSAYKRGSDNQKQFYTRYNEKGRIKYTIAYDWNDLQQKSRILVTDKEKESKSLNVYDYLSTDKHGNWTQCLMQCLDMKKDKEKKFEKFSKRTLEYFENTPAESTP
jgi:hypothetical protein